MIIDCQECRNKECFGCPVNIQHNQMHLKKSIEEIIRLQQRNYYLEAENKRLEGSRE